MIFLSAQPDTYYFLWQLQLQIFNFNRLGIKKEAIHVLISYNKELGLSPYFKKFISENKQANFYTYPDTRKKKAYESSVRPHVITKHYQANKWLEHETIFYHDSDIIFNYLPDFKKLSANDIWYASDTRNYTDSNYIKRTAGNEIFSLMCQIIRVDQKLVEANDNNMGGAQYLLKNVSVKFWRKLERDCESVYNLLYKHNIGKGFCNKNESKIQAWCTDMWCLWWQALGNGKKISIHPILDFSWANTKLINNIDNNSIVHYTGKVPLHSNIFFRKNNYNNCTPFLDDFSMINQNTASYLVIKEIKQYNLTKLKKRIRLDDFTFIITIDTASQLEIENANIVLRYLHQHFLVNINVLALGNNLNLAQEILNPIISDTNIKSSLKEIIKSIKTNNLCLYPNNVIISINDLQSNIKKMKINSCILTKNKYYKLDLLMSKMFIKVLDIDLLEQNKGKLRLLKNNSRNHCLFFKKECNIIESLIKYNNDTVEMLSFLKRDKLDFLQVEASAYLMHTEND